MDQASVLAELGRFAEPALLILTSLAGGAKHGYAMVDDIERLSGVHLRPTTLYAALARLEQQGLVVSLPRDERRRPYLLTETGKAALREQLRSMESFVSAGLARLAPEGGC
jgi:DNA-binding PadR family transcriptional regulator